MLPTGQRTLRPRNSPGWARGFPLQRTHWLSSDSLIARLLPIDSCPPPVLSARLTLARCASTPLSAPASPHTTCARTRTPEMLRMIKRSGRAGMPSGTHGGHRDPDGGRRRSGKGKPRGRVEPPTPNPGRDYAIPTVSPPAPHGPHPSYPSPTHPPTHRGRSAPTAAASTSASAATAAAIRDLAAARCGMRPGPGCHRRQPPPVV